MCIKIPELFVGNWRLFRIFREDGTHEVGHGWKSSLMFYFEKWIALLFKFSTTEFVAKIFSNATFGTRKSERSHFKCVAQFKRLFELLDFGFVFRCCVMFCWRWWLRLPLPLFQIFHLLIQNAFGFQNTKINISL